MRGAERRRAGARIDAAIAAWIGAHCDGDGLREFVEGQAEGPRKPLPPEAQAHALESMRNKMAVITMDEYRARLKGRQ